MLKKMLLVLLSISGFYFVISLENVNASSTHYLTSFPKQYRGNWYAYDKDEGLIKERITKNKIVYRTTKDAHDNDYNEYLHRYVKHNPLKTGHKEYKKTMDWAYASNTKTKIHGFKWLWIYGWNATAGDGDFLNYHKFNGHQVLTEAGGAEVWVDIHYYRTPKLAKQLANKRYNGFKYYPKLN